MSPWLGLCAVLILAAILLNRWYSRRGKRRELLATPLTSEQRKVFGRLVPLVSRLPAPLRISLDGKIELFLDQITFRGQNGLDVTEEMRLSIAAQRETRAVHPIGRAACAGSREVGLSALLVPRFL